jgi:hypothetical protein
VSNLNIEDPRSEALEAMAASLPASTWNENAEFVGSLKDKIKAHSFGNNKIIEALSSGKFSLEQVKKIHLEYRHAIVQIFTDALLMAQFQTRQLEPRLNPGDKMAPRVLIALNILDEFGYTPGVSNIGYYKGHHEYSHYVLYEKLLNELGISAQDRNEHAFSGISNEVRCFLESSFTDYASIVALLAVSEEQVILFSPPLRKSVGKHGYDVAKGYYRVHGTTDDADTDGADDDHENDLWSALTQACTKENYEKLTSDCLAYCDLWDEFWDHQLLENPISEQVNQETLVES